MKNIFPLFLVLGMAIWSVWPLVKCGDCVADLGKDGELITWIINTSGKNIYGIFSGTPGQLFDGNIFYPYKNVLAYSDMFMITALWVFPGVKILSNSMIANVLAITGGQILTTVIIFKWWEKISKNSWAAAVGTIAFALSMIRLHYQVHLQMWGLQLLVVGCWLLVSWIEDKKDWKLYLGAGILGLQVWESLLPVYFAGLIIGARIIAELINITLFYPPLNLRGGRKKGVILAVIIFAIIASPPLLAYWGVGREFNFRRDIREAAHNGMSINDLWGKFNSPGLYILLGIAILKMPLSLIPPLNLRGGKQGGVQKEILWLTLVLVASLIMALGPTLKWQGKTVKIAGKIPIPLPYAAAYYTVPGFGALRTPSRWMWVAGLSMSGLIAIGLAKSQILNSKFQTNYKYKPKILITSLMLVAVIGGYRIEEVRKLPSYDTLPQVYKQLEKMLGKVVLELPMGDENVETERMLYSLYHGKILVNGFSGFTPPGYGQTETINEGVDYVVIDKQKPHPKSLSLFQEREILWEDKDYLIYGL